MTRAVIALGVLLLLGTVLLVSTSGQQTKPKSGMKIDPTADIHPSVILEGKVTVGAYTKIDAGTVITGNVTIGHHSLVRCNVTIRARTPSATTSTSTTTCASRVVGLPRSAPRPPRCPTKSIIGDHCWVNHGAMQGTQMGNKSAVGLNACCDYNTRLGEGAVLANGSATHFDQVIPANSFAEGVPAVVKKQNITDEDRKAYFGLIPAEWTRYEGSRQEENARKKQGGK